MKVGGGWCRNLSPVSTRTPPDIMWTVPQRRFLTHAEERSQPDAAPQDGVPDVTHMRDLRTGQQQAAASLRS